MKCPVQVVMEADSFRILVDVAAQGLAVTALPKSAVRPEVEAGILATARIVSPALEREVIVAWAGNGVPSIAASAVSSILRDEVTRAFGFPGTG